MGDSVADGIGQTLGSVGFAIAPRLSYPQGRER